MLYQETFQSGENTSEINVSSCVYINGYKHRNGGFPNHCHSFFELEYIIEGNSNLRINGKIVHPPQNSLVIKPPLCIHGAIGVSRSVSLLIQFGYNLLSRNASTLLKNSLIVPNEELQSKGFIVVESGSPLDHYLNDISNIVPSFITPVDLEKRQIAYSPQYEWKLNALTLNIVTYLIEQGYLDIVQNSSGFSDVSQIQVVLNRLITRPEEKLSMEDAAQMAYMSYSYFSRTFTKIIGCSFVDYCNNTKIHRAEELLESTNSSITEISHNLGFGSVSYFNRIFKKVTGGTPMQYRNNHNG